MSSLGHARDLRTTDLPLLFQLAIDEARSAQGDLERVLALTFVCEEIALRTQIDRRQLSDALSTPEAETQFFQVIAHGAATVGDLLVKSLAAEEKKDAVELEKLDELGARLQAATVALAKLGSTKGVER